MEARSKEAILSKTHYGIGIYAHILRLYYPDQTVLSLSGRTCSPTKNPFNADKSTLNIFIEKETVLGNALDKEFARHSDSENAIPAGDAFDFAELHYKQSGDELLQTLNKEMNLHIGEKFDFYANGKKSNNTPDSSQTQSPPVGDLGGFSHSNYFAAVANYILQTYGVEVDKSGRDISRACFLPHDPQAYINPRLLNSCNSQKFA